MFTYILGGLKIILISDYQYFLILKLIFKERFDILTRKAQIFWLFLLFFSAVGGAGKTQSRATCLSRSSSLWIDIGHKVDDVIIMYKLLLQDMVHKFARGSDIMNWNMYSKRPNNLCTSAWRTMGQDCPKCKETSSHSECYRFWFFWF